MSWKIWTGAAAVAAVMLMGWMGYAGEPVPNESFESLAVANAVAEAVDGVEPPTAPSEPEVEAESAGAPDPEITVATGAESEHQLARKDTHMQVVQARKKALQMELRELDARRRRLPRRVRRAREEVGEAMRDLRRAPDADYRRARQQAREELDDLEAALDRYQ